MGENGRRYFLERFERKTITKQWKEVLEAVRSREYAVGKMEAQG